MSGYTALRQRWQTPEGKELAEQIWVHLVAGRLLDGLGLDSVDGRVDLRGIEARLPATVGEPKTYRVQIGEVEVPGIGKITPPDLQFRTAETRNLTKFREVQLHDLDFRGSSLPYLWFVHATVANCRFDDTGCREWRMFATEMTDCTFAGANLAEAKLGGYQDGRYNRFDRVDFTRANLSKTVFNPSYLTDCDFGFAKVHGTKFEGASLVRCRFAGKLRSVIFDGRVLTLHKKPDPNPMEDIDMSGVTDFDGVEFRAVNFDRVVLPEDPDLFVIRDPGWAPWALNQLGDRHDLPADFVRIHLESDEGPDRKGHLFVDIGQIGDPDAQQLMRELLAERPPAT